MGRSEAPVPPDRGDARDGEDCSFPLPVALALLRGTYASDSYGPIMAAAALSAVPLLVVFLVANRRIVEGVRVGGLKG